MRIALIALEPSPESALLRAHLEHLGAEVHLRGIGRPSDVFSAFAFYDWPADCALISGHGDADGLCMPEMAPGVDPLVLENNRLGPAALAKGLGALPETIVSTACSSGTAAMADAFLHKGAARYIAPVGDPDGAGVPLLVAALFYGVLHEGRGWDDALARANRLAGADGAFTLFGAARA